MDNEWATSEEAMRVETLRETDEKCFSCGGTMDFDPQSGGLLCPYCGYSREISAGAQATEQNFATAQQTGNVDWGVAKKTVICKNCGAESVYDALQVASECLYCGSNQVMEAATQDTLAPGGVVPFGLDGKAAGVRFGEWIRGKLFCPRVAKQKAQPEAFAGVYLPYWTFDADTTSRYSGQYGINRQEKDRDGKTRTVTDWYSVSGTYQRFVDDAQTCGSTRHDEAHLRGIEPFDTAANVAYKPEYVAGFAAERYSLGLESAFAKVQQNIDAMLQREVADKVRREKRADTVQLQQFATEYANVKYKYLLLPVWLSSFTYKSKIYQFMVNGQTGKVAGKSPVSPLRVAVAILAGILVVALLWWLFQ